MAKKIIVTGCANCPYSFVNWASVTKPLVMVCKFRESITICSVEDMDLFKEVIVIFCPLEDAE